MRPLRLSLGSLLSISGVFIAFHPEGLELAVGDWARISSVPVQFLTKAIIAGYLVGGILLILDVWRRCVSAFLCAILSLSAFFLLYARSLGEKTDTFTFDGWHISIPIILVVFLTIVEIYAVCVVGFSRSAASVRTVNGQPREWITYVRGPIFLFSVLLQIGVIFEILNCDSKIDMAGDLSLAAKFATSKDSCRGESRNDVRIFVLLSLSDFNCTPCLEDFLRMCGDFREKLKSNPRLSVFGIMKRESELEWDSKERLSKWIAGMDLPFPIHLGPDSIFAAARFERSFVAVVRGKGEVLFRAEFPLGYRNNREIMRFASH